MAKKRTKKQKIKASLKPVNTHFEIKFKNPIVNKHSDNKIENMAQKQIIASIKHDLYKSLFIATLIVLALLVIYWVS